MITRGAGGFVELDLGSGRFRGGRGKVVGAAGGGWCRRPGFRSRMYEGWRPSTSPSSYRDRPADCGRRATTPREFVLAATSPGGPASTRRQGVDRAAHIYEEAGECACRGRCWRAERETVRASSNLDDGGRAGGRWTLYEQPANERRARMMLRATPARGRPAEAEWATARRGGRPAQGAGGDPARRGGEATRGDHSPAHRRPEATKLGRGSVARRTRRQEGHGPHGSWSTCSSGRVPDQGAGADAHAGIAARDRAGTAAAPLTRAFRRGTPAPAERLRLHQGHSDSSPR